MKLLNNAKTLLTQPTVIRDYIKYQTSRWKNKGQPVRVFSGDIRITGWSGFSEYHSSKDFMNPAEREFFNSFPLQLGDIIDVGANVGVVSITFSKLFPNYRIHAFEPNPSTVDALKHNVSLNRRENICIRPLVVADYDGTVSFDANPVNRGTTSIASEGNFLTDLTCITLDTYAEKENISEVSLLKVDVEGYEENVFKGAEKLLNQQKIKAIYYEVCPDNARKAGLDPKSPTQFLRSRGYSIYRLDKKANLCPVKDRDFDRTVLENWVALNPDQCRLNAQRLKP